ncbi:efflux RND transporter permease subunit [Veronia pacifica]|uniref:RND transporter n=1 Tax=Veronia pacifica TaxID=1080227 RepID=A0A1C3ERU5_9GAMM|nr:MMPL family transporter [Veronia pacifica]ODA35944.1 RND transporter [Veronia pacifica]
MKEKFLQWPVNRAWWFLCLTMLVVILASIGNKDLYFRGDYKIFFDEGNPQLLAFEKLENSFAKTDTMAIVVAPKDNNIFTESTLQLIREMTDRAWQTPFASRVDSIANYQHTTAEDDDLVVEDLVPDYYPLTEQRLAYVRNIALNEPRLTGLIISPAADVTMINITLQLSDGDQTNEVYEVTEFGRQLMAEMKTAYPNVDFYMTGAVALDRAFAEAAMEDGNTLIPMMFVAILILLTIMLRSWRFVFATLLVIAASITTTMGLLGWIDHYLTNGTVNVPTVVMTLAVADCVHVIVSYISIRREGKAHKPAIIESLSMNFMALLITSVTTAFGFLMMNASASPVLRELGTLTAIGVMIAFLLSVTLLPALLTLLPERKGSSNAQQAPNKAMLTLADLVIRYHKMILPTGIVVIILSAVMLLQNQVNDEPFEYFDKNSSYRTAIDFIDEKLSGSTNISIGIDSGEESGINDPAFLRTLDTFTLWLNQQPEIDHVASLSDTFKRLNKNMHGDDAAYYKLPDNKELAAQYLLLYEMSLPYGLDLNNELNIDKSAVKMSLTLANLGSKELVEFEQRVYQWFQDNAPQYQVIASSPSLMFAHVGENNMGSMLKTLPITLIVISTLLVFALRSPRLGVLSLIPNIAPAVLGFGLWALISGEINLGLSVVVSMTMGIVVDDAVHFLTKYRYARLRGDNVEAGIRYAFSTVGWALWVTTVVLVVGFSILASSDFRINGDMGMLSALVIFIALMVDFTILPAALLIFDRKPYRRKTDGLPKSVVSHTIKGLNP